MAKKCDFNLITTAGAYVMNTFIREEGEDIAKQVSFDFHTCFEGNSVFFQEQEPGVKLRNKGRAFSV